MPLLAAPELQFCDQNGRPYAAGTLDTWIVGTTTPKQTWTNPALSVLNTNPVVLDSAGRCLLYGDGAYRIRLKDALGNVIYDQPTDSLISLAMVPVVSASTLAAARTALGVDTAIAAEATIRAAADTAETTRATTAEGTLTTNLAAEVTRATTAEGVNATAIAAETTRAMAAEAALAIGAASNYAEVYTTTTQHTQVTLNNIGGRPVKVTVQAYPGSTNNFPAGTDVFEVAGIISRDGVQIGAIGAPTTFLPSLPVWPLTLDNPGAGTHVYAVDFYVPSGLSGPWSDYASTAYCYILVQSV